MGSTDFPNSLSLTIRLHHPSLLAALLDYILCPYRAVDDMFSLVVQYLHIRVKGSIEERRLLVRLYFSRSVLYVLFVWFGPF